MSANPYGPLTEAEFREAVEAPYGGALAILRKRDPLWGRAPGEKIKWRVTFSRRVHETGSATVEAASEEDANALAEKLEDSDIDWWADDGDCGVIESVDPE